jgi:ribonuclease HII
MGFRRGYGRGRGYGFGPATGGYPYPMAFGTGYPSKTDEMEMLRADAEAMRQSLDAIQRRLTELEKEGSE